VRPTHHFKNRIVPKWCVGRTLPIGLNLMALMLCLESGEEFRRNQATTLLKER